MSRFFTCGYNTNGVLGLGDVVHRSSPVQVGALANWFLSIGANDTAAIKLDNTIWVWGVNGWGEFGLGDLDEYSSPTQVGSLTDWKEVDIYAILVAIKTDGALWTCGGDNGGRLGNGTNAQHKSSPIQVGSDTDWFAVSSGVDHSHAIKTDKTLWAWGTGTEGQLGIVTRSQYSSPIQVGTDSDWFTVNAARYFNHAIKMNGTLWTWGDNDFNNPKLGIGDNTPRSSPVQIGSANDWLQVDALWYHGVGLRDDGSIWVWGSNDQGQLGQGNQGTGTEQSSPVQIGSRTDWESVNAGYETTYFVSLAGEVWGVGANFGGQLGQGNTIDYSSPVQIGTLGDWNTVGGSENFASFIYYAPNPFTQWTWGQNTYGELGQGSGVHLSSPVQLGSLIAWSSSTGGTRHTITIKIDGSLWTWGDNATYGQLGLGDLIPRSSPVQIGSLTSWEPILAGDDHSLITGANRTLWSWGKNTDGQLGLADVAHRSLPVQIGSLTNWSFVSSGGRFSHAIKTDGTLWAWGGQAADYGALGLGDNTDRSSPVQVGALTTWDFVSAGNLHVLALKTDGTLWSWGYNFTGELGLGDTTNRSAPVQIGTGTNWSSAFTGYEHSLAVKTDGTLWAWGGRPSDNYGQLGLGDTVNRSSPTQVGSLTNWNFARSGHNHSRAIKTDGTLWSWGRNNQGQLGLTDILDRSSPAQVGSSGSWIEDTNSGQFYSLGLKFTEGSICWGHRSRVDEDTKRRFAKDWTTTGPILKSGNRESVELASGESKESSTWNLGSGIATIDLDKYLTGYDSASVVTEYKTGATPAACEAASWTVYNGTSFTSSGWVKIRLSRA